MTRQLKIINDISNELFDGITLKLDGNNIKTPEDLYALFKEYIYFPDYFGENWDAFFDVITDRDFIKDNVRVLISNYANMFNDYENKKIFTRILVDWLHTKFLDIDINILILEN